jgi:hypothetical protein
MSESFEELYRDSLKEVFMEHARQRLEQGDEALPSANAYAFQGKPEFALAFLLLADASDDVKREILAHSYERRAVITDEKAASFDEQFHRPFPLIRLEAQKDRLAAKQVRQGKRVRRENKPLSLN